MIESGDYISREAANEACREAVRRYPNSFYNGIEAARDAIRKLPAADVRPVVKATWKRIDFKPCGHDYECSSCGWKNDMATHFCPNCGADMREKI